MTFKSDSICVLRDIMPQDRDESAMLNC